MGLNDLIIEAIDLFFNGETNAAIGIINKIDDKKLRDKIIILFISLDISNRQLAEIKDKKYFISFN